MIETNKTTQHKIILNIVIVLLLAFTAIQLYGIFSSPSAAVSPKRPNAIDSVQMQIQINVLNGCGMNGVGITMTKFCRNLGYDVVEMGNYKSFDVEETMVIDRSGKMETAKHLAELIGILPKNVMQQFSSEHMVAASVVIGKDFKKLRPWNK
ncbi:MAG: LytR C-terminal domain-containing protein [Bacteroidota bacterium]|nr:LytR C-terminal domain-containing protein [Bacteroidota bacterium]